MLKFCHLIHHMFRASFLKCLDKIPYTVNRGIFGQTRQRNTVASAMKLLFSKGQILHQNVTVRCSSLQHNNTDAYLSTTCKDFIVLLFNYNFQASYDFPKAFFFNSLEEFCSAEGIPCSTCGVIMEDEKSETGNGQVSYFRVKVNYDFQSSSTYVFVEIIPGKCMSFVQDLVSLTFSNII